MEIQELQNKAERLAVLRNGLRIQDETHKALTDPLKAERDAIQDELLADMARENVASLRVTGGDMYTRATRKGISIVDEVKARFWARDNEAYSIDKLQVTQRLKDAKELPSCFERVETDYISIRKAKE